MSLLAVFLVVLLAVAFGTVYNKTIVTASTRLLKAILAFAGGVLGLLWCWSAWDFLSTRKQLADAAARDAYDWSPRGLLFWIPVVLLGGVAIWSETGAQRKAFRARVSRWAAKFRRADATVADSPRTATGLLILPTEMDDRISDVLNSVLEERLIGLRTSHLDVFRAVLASMPRLGVTDQLPLLEGSVRDLCDALEVWHETVQQEIHSAFQRDGDSVLELFQSRSANSGNYQFTIESKTIRAAAETFGSAMKLVQAAYPELDPTQVSALEQNWTLRQMALERTSYEALKFEVRRALRLTRFRGRLTRPRFGVEVAHEIQQEGGISRTTGAARVHG